MNKRATVLLVDDNADHIELMCLALARSHAPVRFVCLNHGGEVMAYLSRHGKYADHIQFPDPAMILLDLAMPKLNGFDVLRWMQRQSPPMPPVFVLTASQLESDARLARDLGAAAFISKPVDLEGTVVLLESMHDFWTWQDAAKVPGNPPTVVHPETRRSGIPGAYPASPQL